MMIDWFTVVAQLINFLILVWLLKRYLYKPILRAIDAREERITSELSQAEKSRVEAQQARDEFEQKNVSFDQQLTHQLLDATAAVQVERQRLLAEAQQQAEALRIKQQQALQAERQSLSAEIRRRTQEEVFAIAQKTLNDLADVDLEARMSEVFIARLRSLAEGVKDNLQVALTASSDPIIIRSAFSLPEKHRAAISDVLREIATKELLIEFEIASDVIGGIELSANGQKIAWSIANYLTALEQSIDELVYAAVETDKDASGDIDTAPDTYAQHQPYAQTAVEDTVATAEFDK